MQTNRYIQMALRLWLITTGLYSMTAAGQAQFPQGAPVYRNAGAYTDHFSVTDYNGAPFKNIYSGVEGSPFLPDQYGNAVITDKKGHKFGGIQAKFDLVSKELVVVDQGGKEMTLQKGLIKELTINDSLTGILQQYLFRSGYPAAGNNDTNTFYHVLADGPLQLLKAVTKELREEKNIQSGEVRKVIITREEYFTFSNGEIKKLKKDKEFIEALVTDELAAVQQYQKENKLGFRSEKDLVKLFSYYNSLKQKNPF